MVFRSVRFTPAPTSSRNTILRVGHHGAAQLQQLFLPARNLARFFIGDVVDGQEFQHLIGAGADAALFLGHALAPWNHASHRFSPDWRGGTIIRFSRTVME